MGMPFDTLVTNAGRLKILTALAVVDRQEFVQLRRATQLSDGNLASHARRLQEARLIAIHKEFRDGKPVTSFTLTHDGRTALETHARHLLAAIGAAPSIARAAEPAPEAVLVGSAEDDWVD
jgi:DNA-binding MarR family transcriptional regulator